MPGVVDFFKASVYAKEMRLQVGDGVHDTLSPKIQFLWKQILINFTQVTPVKRCTYLLFPFRDIAIEDNW